MQIQAVRQIWEPNRAGHDHELKVDIFFLSLFPHPAVDAHNEHDKGF